MPVTAAFTLSFRLKKVFRHTTIKPLTRLGFIPRPSLKTLRYDVKNCALLPAPGSDLDEFMP